MSGLTKTADWTDVAMEAVNSNIGLPSAMEIENEKQITERLPGVSPGQAREFKTIARSIEDLSIENIQHFNLIPDFLEPTAAIHPIIVRTPTGAFCIEGWPLIEIAQSEGYATILCEVDEMNTHSDTELCLRKCGIRSLTRGGHCTYGEMLRNTRDLLMMFQNSTEDLRIYGHGRRHSGEGFVNNREEDVRHILSLRMGKDRDTINLYLAHSEYLTVEALQIFIELRAPKAFFVKAQRSKRILIKNFLSGNCSLSELIRLISESLLKDFENFLASREAVVNATPAPSEGLRVDHAEAEREVIIDIGDMRQDDPGESLNEEEEVSITASPDENVEPITRELVKSRTREVAQRITDAADSDIPLDEVKMRLQEEMIAIMAILRGIDFLNNKEA